MPEATPMFTPDEQRIARVVLAEIERIGKKANAGITSSILQPELQAQLIEEVTRRIAPAQSALEFAETPSTVTSSIAAVVAKTAGVVVENTISIPRIMVVPKDDFRIEYTPFVLDVSRLGFSPGSNKLLIQSLQTNQREYIGVGEIGFFERNPEDTIVSALVSFSDVDYLTLSEMLYDLAGQVVRHLRETLGVPETTLEETDQTGAQIQKTLLHRIVQDNQKEIARYVYEQMRGHRKQPDTQYEPYIHSGFVPLRKNAFTTPADAAVLPVTQPPPSADRIGQMVYGQFKRCLYPYTKFQSNQERILAGILELESQKWFKPVLGQFNMRYAVQHEQKQHEQKEYQPDFVAELEHEIVMLEVKASNQMTDAIVLEKARVARIWCEHASAHALEHGGKPWRYHLIAHDLILANMSLERLMQVSTT